MRHDIGKFKGLFNPYTELRFQENRNIRISCLNGDVTANTKTTESGVSARCGVSGKWGFSSSSNLSDETVKAVLKGEEEL